MVTCLIIFYFLNPLIGYSYQYDKSIGIKDYSQTFVNLSIPSVIAVDNTGNVYVVDTGNNRTEKFTTDGIFVKE